MAASRRSSVGPPRRLSSTKPELGGEQALSAHRDRELGDADDEHVRGDEREEHECAGAGLGEHHDAEEDRHDSGEPEDDAVLALERRGERGARSRRRSTIDFKRSK
jgi:hypothetical protein